MTNCPTLVRRLAVALLAMLVVSGTCTLAQQMSDKEAAAIAGGVGLVGMLFGCMQFVISVAVALWLYKQAEAAGKSGVGWAIFGLFLWLPALVVWLIVKPR